MFVSNGAVKLIETMVYRQNVRIYLKGYRLSVLIITFKDNKQL